MTSARAVTAVMLTPWRALTRAWQRVWARAPRQLKVTSEGKVLIGLAIAVGFAATNTGNNLLFLGWGLVLSAMVLSGVLSEATLKPLKLSARPPAYARVGEVALIPIVAANTARHTPAFGVETRAVVVRVKGQVGPGQDPVTEDAGIAKGGFELRMEPDSTREARGRFTPHRRGLHRIASLVAATAYPFGFFEKSRNYVTAGTLDFWVAPAQVDVSAFVLDVRATLGEVLAGVAGVGDEFFALRPYRAGDDVRRVYWRRVARTGRMVVVEHEANAGTALLLELHLGRARTDEAHVERAIAVMGSLAEALLASGMRVGMTAPGVHVRPAAGGQHRLALLYALARLNVDDPMPSRAPAVGVCRVAVVADASLAVTDADLILGLPRLESPAPPARGPRA